MGQYDVVPTSPGWSVLAKAPNVQSTATEPWINGIVNGTVHVVLVEF